jgi:hypothetical protein
MRVAEKIELDAAIERELRVLSKRRRVEARLQKRARVILLAAQAGRTRTSPWRLRWIVVKWRCGDQRFLTGGIDALRQDAPPAARPLSRPRQGRRSWT